MKKIFAYNSPVMLFFSHISTMIWISILWLVCCIPVVTIGASTTAMYRMMFNLREDKSTKSAEFFRAFASNFKQGTAVWLLILACAAVLWLFYAAIGFYQNSIISYILLGLFFCFGFLAAAAAAYVFPLLCYFSNSVRRTWSNALLLALGNPVRTVGILLLSLIPVAIFLFAPYAFLTLFIVFLALVPAALAFAIACIIKPVFEALAAPTAENAE